MLAFHVLGSGSKGNSCIVEDRATGHGVLIDCGLTKRATFAHAQECGFDLKRLDAIVITHDHSDHVKGLGVVTRGLAKLGPVPPIHALPEVAASCAAFADLASDVAVLPLALGEPRRLGAIDALPFATSHDAAASCGFRFTSDDGDALGYLTDSGFVTDEALAALAGVRVLALESNHDGALLRNGDYPPAVKARIASERGHLSNEQAAQALAGLLHAGLEHVVAMHVSENNNLPLHVRAALGAVLEEEGHAATLQVAKQSLALSVK